MAETVKYNYLDELNPSQREAVEYLDGPSLVIAGAGSGKTRVLTFKIVHLLRLGVEPYRILALTFTNKAAREMRERIKSLVGENVASRLMMGTFHSIFLNILRRNADKIGYKNGFSIYDTTDSKSLIKLILKEYGLDEKNYKPSTVLNEISNAKNKLITPEQYLMDGDQLAKDKKAKRPMIGRIYETYVERCRLSNAMDFDDILVYMNLLLRDNPDILKHYQEFFKYILVDEFQDTNFAQNLIIQQLANQRNKLFLVGDDAQSIYSFRGAEINNILNIDRKLQFNNYKIFKLEQNYRSTQNIIGAAGSLIDKNTWQIKKQLFSENPLGEKVTIIYASSDFEEAALIANLINQSKLVNHDSYDDYAILYRTNAQSRALEESLRKRNISYRVYGSLSFYQRKEVKDAVAYFRMAVNPNDDESLRRIINFPQRGIGDTTLKRISDAAISKSKSMWQIITETELKEIGLKTAAITKINAFKELIEGFIKDNENGATAFELGQLIFNRTGLLNIYAHENTPESISRHENLTEILSGLKEFSDIQSQTGETKPDMVSYLSQIMLATDQDSKEDDLQPKVTMMTMHAAKGLEYKHVYIVGVEDDLIPSSLSQNSMKEIEEERRLLYVAITRAMTSCTITFAGSRFKNGQTILSKPSRFLADINPKYLNNKAISKMANANYSSNPVRNYYENNRFINRTSDSSESRPLSDNSTSRTKLSSISKSSPIQSGNMKKVSELGLSKVVPQHTPDELKTGDTIKHEKFGIGVIQSIGSISGEPSINVEFREVGLKRLILRFAKFEIL